MDGRVVNEEHFTRLCGVPRPTRVGWAEEKLIAAPSSPYRLEELVEVVVLRALREEFDAGGPIIWEQVRGEMAEATARRPCEVVVDLHTFAASWVARDQPIADWARSGHPIRLVDLSERLEVAATGFRLAARPAPTNARGAVKGRGRRSRGSQR